MRLLRFVATLQGLTAEQLAFRTEPQAWNPVQVGHHVVLAEQRTADSIKKHRGMRSGKRGSMRNTFFLVPKRNREHWLRAIANVKKRHWRIELWRPMPSRSDWCNARRR